MSSQRVQKITVETKSIGPLCAYLHGGRVGKDVAAVTIHDLGCNFKEFYEFVNHEHMSQLTERVFWIHIEVPGQGDNMPDLPPDWKFPTMQKISEGISELCDSLELKHVVLIGDGAGANIAARVAIAREDICLGAILIHCTGTTAGFMESLRDRINAWKLNTIGMHPSVENYLMLHRFGVQDPSFLNASTEAELHGAIKKFLQSLRENINPKNLNKFIKAFMERTNITDSIGNLKCPVLFITGSVASFNHTVYTLYNALMNAIKDQPARKANVEILEIDGVANVMREAPEKVAESVQNFMQGLGVAGGAVNRRMSSTGSIPRNRNRSASMDEYDQPIGVKNLIFDNTRRYSKATDIPGISEAGEH